MAVVVPAVRDYAAWRRRHGRLNFQDLLLLARDLLRDHPQVRRDFQKRFLPVLVDEFQDTDPIQAEILFYLTGRDAEGARLARRRPARRARSSSSATRSSRSTASGAPTS